MPEWTVSELKMKLTGYRYPDEAAKDIRGLIMNFKDLKPNGPDRFVYPNGAQDYLVSLRGTIPVLFKGTNYNIPIAIWLKTVHPLQSPLVYVTPTADMMIKPSKYVDNSGMIYLPYLHEWKMGSSDLITLVQIMCAIFADTCPVYSTKGQASPYPSPQGGSMRQPYQPYSYPGGSSSPPYPKPYPGGPPYPRPAYPPDYPPTPQSTQHGNGAIASASGPQPLPYSLHQETTGNKTMIPPALQLVQKEAKLREYSSQLAVATANNEQLQQQVQSLQQSLQSLQQASLEGKESQLNSSIQSQCSYHSEFWEVPRDDVTLNMHKILGTGAWGYVVEGQFRGQSVAVKCLHDLIRQPEVTSLIRQEISIMAQLRHPNLVLFIAAILDEESDPLIITELLDVPLRKAYEKHMLVDMRSKVSIYRDIACALNYLHLHHHGAIIHRDVSSANVLLEGKPNNQWKAKLSDFGSAKVAAEAHTVGPGAMVYAAPEVRERSGIQQTPKVDVYSFGVLVCEVTVGEFPSEMKYASMVQRIKDSWPNIFHLVTSCTSPLPGNRPTMATVLTELDKVKL